MMWTSSDPFLECRHCRADVVHICGVRTIGADKIVRVEDGRFPFPPVEDIAGGRGVQVETAFWCEACFECWVEGMQFHKGNVHVAWRRIVFPDGATPSDIWRD